VGNFTPWGYSATIGTSNSTGSYHYQFDSATQPYLFTQVTSGYTANEINWIQMTATLSFIGGVAPHVLDYIQLRSNYSSQGESYFHYPTCCATDSAGNLYIGDWDEGCVKKIDTTGKYILKIGSKGTNAGQFQHITGVAISSTGYIYTIDTVRQKVQVFNAAGTFVPSAFDSISWGSNILFSIALDASDNVFITDRSAWYALIHKYTSSGTWVCQNQNTTAHDHFGVAVNTTGYVYVTDYLHNTVEIYDNSLNYIRQFSSVFVGPHAISINGANNVYVCENSTRRWVYIFNPNGNKIGQFNPQSYPNLQAVATFGVTIAYTIDYANETKKFSDTGVYQATYAYEYCNAYLILKYNGGTTSTILDGAQGAIASRGWLNQTLSISGYPNPTALEIMIETKYSWAQHTKSSQYCIDYLRIYGTVIDLENLTIIEPLDYSDPDKTFTCDIHFPVIFSIDARDYSGCNLYLEIKPAQGIVIREFAMIEHWITPQNFIFSYTFAIASTYVFLVKANDSNGYQVLSEVYNVIIFDNPYPKQSSLHYYASDYFGLDPDLFKTYLGTDEATEIDYFYNGTHLNWQRIYLTSNASISYDALGIHTNISHNGLQATLRMNIVINESGFSYPFYTADTISFACQSPDAFNLVLILGGYNQGGAYFSHAKDYNLTIYPGLNTYLVPIASFTTFNNIWLLTHFGFYGTGNFTVAKIAGLINSTYRLQSDDNRVLPPSIEFSRGWETILVTDYFGQQIFRNYTQWRSFIDIQVNFFITLLYNPADYPVNFIIERGAINITYTVPPHSYLEIRIVASIYNVTVSTLTNSIITEYEKTISGFYKEVLTFNPPPTPLTGGYNWWEFFTGFYGFLTYVMIGLVLIVYLITRHSRKSGKKNTEHDIATYLTIYRMGLEDGNKKQSNEQIERKIRKVWVK